MANITMEFTTAAGISNDTIAPVKTEFIETKVERILILWFQPIIILVGTIGNIMAFIVLLRSRMRNTSVYFFLMVLAVADTSVLYISAFKTWIRMLNGFELLTASNAACKSVMFLMLLSSHMAAWIVVLVTVDRFIAVWFPLKASTMCTLRRAVISTVILTAILIVYNLHVFWTFSIRAKLPARCVPDKNRSSFEFILGPFNYLRLVTYCLLPFVCILYLNIAIIVRLRWTSPALRSHVSSHATINPSHSQSTVHGTWPRPLIETDGESTAGHFSRGTGTSASTTVRMSQQTRVTYMLLSVSITWLLLTAPTALFSLIRQWPSSDPHTNAVDSLIKLICFHLMFINHSINFFLYCLTGKKFRRELSEMMCGAIRHRRRLTISSPSVKTLRSNCMEMEVQDSLLRRPT